jgi:anti-sigma regulatory factor (Ser/Thr protein kinase)
MEWQDDAADRSDHAPERADNGGRDIQSFTCTPSSARSARAFVCKSLRRHGATRPVVNDFKLVVSELAANAIEHGGGAEIVVTVDFTDSQWWVVEVAGESDDVEDHILDPDSWTITGPGAMSGRGLGIARVLMDDIAMTIASRWMTIRCRRRVAATLPT